MIDWSILSTLTFFPLIGVLIISIINDTTLAGKQQIRTIAFLSSLFVLVMTVYLFFDFDNHNSQFQFQETNNIMSYHLGIDGISILFILLTAILIPFCILSSWQNIKENFKIYISCFLILETMLLGAFCSLNIMLFYVFFEGSLIPIFIIIGVWGGKNRIKSSYKFFLYNFLASVFMLVAIMTIYKLVGSLDFINISKHHFSNDIQIWLWLGFFFAFAVKLPLWPFHTLLRDVYVEAPTAGSAILGGAVLKLAGYGFLRFSLAMFPHASIQFAPLILTLSVVGIIYTSMVALVQKDIKRLIAYASVAHMGYVTLGIFSFNVISIEGAIFQMFSHAILTAAMFFCTGIIYDRIGSHKIATYGGLAINMPIYATIFLIFIMANIGLPGTSGFIGEFLTLIGSFKTNAGAVIFATLGIVLSACYALTLYKDIMFGSLVKEKLKAVVDLSLREKILLFPLVASTLFLGIYPMAMINTISCSVEHLVSHLC